MVTRDDLQLRHLPAVCCANCGFLQQDRGDNDGENWRTGESVSLYERASGPGYLNEQLWFGDRTKLVALRCWMRRDFPGTEARPSISGDAQGKQQILDAMHRDRSETSAAFCPQFTPWVPHLTLEQHWDERRTYLRTSESHAIQREINRTALTTQFVVGGVGAMVALVIAAVTTWTSFRVAELPTRIEGTVPVAVVTPTQGEPPGR